MKTSRVCTKLRALRLRVNDGMKDLIHHGLSLACGTLPTSYPSYILLLLLFRGTIGLVYP
jgi:hypothetical protein